MKSAYQKAAGINPETTARSAGEIVELLKTVLHDKMKTLEFLEVMEIKSFPRPAKETVQEIKVPGIQQLHSITRLEDGWLVGRQLSCSECSLGQLCSNCKSLQPIYTPDEDSNNEETQDAEENEDVEVEGDADAAEDECESEAGEEDPDTSNDEEEELGPGSVVWVRFRSWYPAEVLGVHQLSAKQRAAVLSPDTVYVRRFGSGDTRLAKVKFLDRLGEDAVDAARDSKGSNEMI